MAMAGDKQSLILSDEAGQSLAGADFSVHIAQRRHHNHRNIAGAPDGGQLFPTIHTGQHHIKQDKIGLEARNPIQAFQPITGDGELVIFPTKVRLQHIGRIGGARRNSLSRTTLA